MVIKSLTPVGVATTNMTSINHRITLPYRQNLTGISIYILIFSITYSVGMLFAQSPNLPPKSAVIPPTIFLLLYIVGRLDKIEMNKFKSIVRYIGFTVPFIILYLGSIIGLINIKETYPIYFFGDFYAVFQFVILWLAFSEKKNEQYSSQIFYCYLIAITVLYIVEFFVSLYHYSYIDVTAKARFNPPNYLLFVTVCWLFFSKKKWRLFPLVLGLLFLYASAGFRVSLIIAIFILITIASLNWRHVLSANTILILVLPLIIFVLALDHSQLFKLRSTAEVEKTFIQYKKGILYQTHSFQTHLYEGIDSYNELIDRGSIVEILFGKGHGAMFQPVILTPEDSHKVTEKGIHHIHTAPAMFFFRYGILGFFWYLILFVFVGIKTLKYFLSYLKARNLTTIFEVNDYVIICYLYLFSMMLGSIMGNVFTLPFVPFTFYLANSLEMASTRQVTGEI